MTEDVIRLIQELGFPIALSGALAFVLYRVIMWLLVSKVDSVLQNFERRHEFLAEKMDGSIDKTERNGKDLAKIKSDLKILVDYILKGK